MHTKTPGGARPTPDGNRHKLGVLCVEKLGDEAARGDANTGRGEPHAAQAGRLVGYWDRRCVLTRAV
jgi:hypothetical protein